MYPSASNSATDFVSSLGSLTLDHRFKRLMNELLAQADVLYRELGLPLKPRWCSMLQLLESRGPLSVGEVADALKLSHPAVVQILDDMRASRLVSRRKSQIDARRRVVALTSTGEDWMPVFHRVWRALTHAQDEVFSGSGEWLALVARAEAELDRKPVSKRARARLRNLQPLIERARRSAVSLQKS